MNNKLIALSALTLLPMCIQAKTDKKPNIIVVYCDDMGYGDLSCFGNPSIKTPILDQMALEGQKWSSFYVSASVSSPSRAGLLTGRLGVRTGLYGDQNRVLFPHSAGGFPDTELSMADILKTAGYQTAMVGKWHIGHHAGNMPLAHGFEYFIGAPFSNDMSKKEQAKIGNKKYPHEYVIYNQDEIMMVEPDQTNITKFFTKEATRYIDHHSEKPFFLYLAHPMPHFPVYASKKFQGKSARGVYGDTIEELDWSMGELLKCLKKNGIEDNTLIVFTSDNGPWLPYKQQAGTAGPLKDGKASHFEGGFRVPCIIWGSMVSPGHITDMASTLDLLPTFCELAGAELPKDRTYDGISLCNVLKNSKKHCKREIFYFYRGSKLFAIRKGDYKLHFMDQPAYGSRKQVILEKPVLYNISVDPEERYDISESNPEIVEELKRLAKAHLSSFQKAESIFDL